MTEPGGAWLLWLLGVLALAALAGGPLGAHRLGLWLERRGWLYYTRASRKGRASLAIAAAFDPNARRILEIQEQERTDQDESGDDPFAAQDRRGT